MQPGKPLPWPGQGAESSNRRIIDQNDRHRRIAAAPETSCSKQDVSGRSFHGGQPPHSPESRSYSDREESEQGFQAPAGQVE